MQQLEELTVPLKYLSLFTKLCVINHAALLFMSNGSCLPSECAGNAMPREVHERVSEVLFNEIKANT